MKLVDLFTFASIDIGGDCVQLNTGTLVTMWHVHLGCCTGVKKGFFVQH